MIYKYLKGSRGITGGSKGGDDKGSSGGTVQPYDLDALVDPFFITNEYLQTIAGTNKQLQGMRDMLHSLPAPSSAPEVFTPEPNYNVVDQQYADAESKLKSTPILGTSIDQQIAQQQALGEQGVALDHQRIQALSDMRNSALAQAAKDEYQNALSRHKTAEDRRVFDMGIKQQVQDNEDAATAIKTDAAKKVGQEFYSLAKMRQLKKDRQALAEMQRDYYRRRDNDINAAEDAYNVAVEQEFRDQFDADLNNMEDLEEFETKYGIDREQYRDDESAMYDSDAYKSKLAAYKTEKEADWIKEKNQLLKDYDEQWWRDYGDTYYTLIAKRGGSITELQPRSRYLSKKDRIAVDNNRALHEFVKQMNQKQKEIFLKLMSL